MVLDFAKEAINNMKEETYELSIQCSNCGANKIITIPCGIRVRKFISNNLEVNKCENCKCDMVYAFSEEMQGRKGGYRK